MTAKDLAQRITDLAEKVRADHLGTAGVLYAVAGAVQAGAAEDLLRYLEGWTRRQLDLLSPRG